MKKLIILLTLITALVLTSCKNEDQPKSTATKAPEQTQAVTATPSPTAEPTEAPTPTPSKEPLGDKLGIPQEDAEVIFMDDYEEGVPADESMFRYSNGHEIVDGKLYLSRYHENPVELADAYSVD